MRRIPPDKLELSMNFAPDGSYPARLLTIGNSIWLVEGMKQEFASGVFAVCERGQCYLFQDVYMEQRGVLINGQPYWGRIKLQDGDFIQIKKLKFVFQADPAGDKRKAWESEFNGKPIPTTSITRWGNLQRQVIITPDSISLDGGKSMVPWMQLNTLLIQKEPQYDVIHISLGQVADPENFFAHQLGTVSLEELRNFLSGWYILLQSKLVP